jgi:hypothetical protein
MGCTRPEPFWAFKLLQKTNNRNGLLAPDSRGFDAKLGD